MVVTARGEVDLATVGLLSEPLLSALSGGGGAVVDLTEVGFLGAAGLALLARAHAAGEARGGALRVVAPTRAVLRPLRATGLHGTLRVFPSVREAVRAG